MLYNLLLKMFQPTCMCLSQMTQLFFKGEVFSGTALPSSTHDIDRQPLLATVTKDSVEFVFNEALLCIHSVIRAIWLSSLNMPLHFTRKFGRVSKGRQLAL